MEYSPVVLDAINHKTFPKVELFVRLDGKFTLYKPAETKLTIHNIERLREGGVEFVYINSADSEEVQGHIEERLDDSQAAKTLSQYSRNLISSQIINNCIDDVFQHPHNAAAFKKCHSVLQKISFEFADQHELFQLFAKLEGNFEKYLITHSTQTTILAMYLAGRLFNATGEYLLEIGLGSMLHDIGMLNVAGDITQKVDALTESEYHRVKLHPKQGIGLLRDVGITNEVVRDIVLFHHERANGTGYPKGLDGPNIPRHAMLVSLCDIYCALTMTRPYKSASTPAEAFQTLKSEKRLFDPDILAGFLSIMAEAVPPPVEEEKQQTREAGGKSVDMAAVREMKRHIRNAGSDRTKLVSLHSILTDSIQNSYGEEKVALSDLRIELKNLLNSLFNDNRPA